MFYCYEGEEGSLVGTDQGYTWRYLLNNWRPLKLDQAGPVAWILTMYPIKKIFKSFKLKDTYYTPDPWYGGLIDNQVCSW